MATAQEGGATANSAPPSTSSYGAGGKFRKKPLRRQTTPYERPPPTAIRANNENNNGNWLTKLVVDPASRLISYGANRFFASFSRRRLPPPPPPPEVNHETSEGPQGAVSYNQPNAKEPTDGESIQPINNFSSKGISDLEQLLTQKTFTRSEVDHLTELLQSRATKGSLRNKATNKDETATNFGRHDNFAIVNLGGHRNEGIRSPGVTSSPIIEKVHEDNLGSPAELAKAYMGSRPSKVSPSMLGMQSQVDREGTGLFSNIPFTTKSPVTSLTTKTSLSLGAPENGFITPRSRGRSAIYNMARTPYSRVRATSIHLGTGVKNDGYAGRLLPLSLPSPSQVKHDEKFEYKPMTLKRRSSVVDDEVGSVGPVRRTRQKHNLFARGTLHIAHEEGTSSSKQKLPLIGEPRENGNKSVMNSSFANVPSKSSEVASRILQHLDKLTPKEKSSVPKNVTVQENSPFKLTSSMLRGQALRSLEDVDSSRLLLDGQDDYNLEDRSYATLPDVRDSTSSDQGKVEDGSKEFVPFEQSPIKKIESAVFSKSSGAIDTGSVVSNGISQPPQKKRAFRMSAQEDYLDLDDDVQCNGTAMEPYSEGRGPVEVPLPKKSDLSRTEDPRFVETIIPPLVKAPSDFVSSKTSLNGPVKVGEGSTGFAFRDSKEATSASASLLPLSAAQVDKPEEAKEFPPLLNFSSKVADRIPHLPSESSKNIPETKLENSSSLVNASAPTGFELKSPESDNGGHLTSHKAGDRIEKSDDGPSSTSNGLFASKPPAMPFAATPLGDTNKVSTGGAFLFTPSTSVSNFASNGSGTSISASSNGSIFGSAMAPATVSGPVSKFSASIDPSTAVSTATTTKISDVADLPTKVEISRSSGSSSSLFSNTPAFAAAGSGSSIFGLTSNTHSNADNLGASLFSSANKSSASGVGTIPQSSTVQSVFSASLPSFNTSSNTSFGSSLSNSQGFNTSITFGFSSSASSSDTKAAADVSVPVSSIAKFGASSTVLSDGNAVGSSSNASPGIFGFGLSSSSTSTNAAGSSSSASLPVFGFGAAASVPASTVANSSSFSNSASGVFNFGASSSASSSASNAMTSNSAPSSVFGSSWQNPNSSIFGSANTSQSPSTGFLFGASSTPSNTSQSLSTGFIFGSSSTSSAPTNVAPTVFNSFTAASASALSTPSQSFGQPVFGGSSSGFAASPGNTYQMNGEDSMAEDPVQSSSSVFGQPPVSPSPFAFGQPVPTQSSPFQFGGQQNPVLPHNPSPFQASSSLEFNAGGSFSLGSGGVDKSNRKIVRVNKNRNRKK